MILFLPYALSAIAVLFGLAGNWWFSITDWNTAAIAAVALVACVYVAQTDRPWARLAITVIIGASLYLKGGVDRAAQLANQHESDKAAIHAAYALAAETEQGRQQNVNVEALDTAAKDKERQDEELASLRTKLTELEAAAKKDPRASEQSLSHDAVRRLNSLRLHGGGGS